MTAGPGETLGAGYPLMGKRPIIMVQGHVMARPLNARLSASDRNLR